MNGLRNPPYSSSQLMLLLGLTPLLGVTLEFGPAVIFGFLFLIVLTAVAVLAGILRESAPRSALFPACLGLSVVLTTLFDLALTVLLPETRKTLGPYLLLLALNPMILGSTLEDSADDWTETASQHALTGLKFWGLTALFGLIRELLGQGSLSLVTGKKLFDLPILDKGPLLIFLLPSGALFLAAIAAAIFQWAEPRWQERKRPLRSETPPPAPAPSVSVPDNPAPGLPNEAPTVAALLKTPAPPIPQTNEESPLPVQEPEKSSTSEISGPAQVHHPWGESLESVIQSFGSAVEPCRFLILGSGTGELVYYAAMLGMEVKRNHPHFEFRLRGTETFATRIQTAVEGIYRESLLDFIPVELKQNYLLRNRDDDRHLLRITDAPRAYIEFVQADLVQTQVFFDQPCDLVVLNQSIDFLSAERQNQLMASICEHLHTEGALILRAAASRDFIPEGFRRTGDQVFRKK